MSIKQVFIHMTSIYTHHYYLFLLRHFSASWSILSVYLCRLCSLISLWTYKYLFNIIFCAKYHICFQLQFYNIKIII